MDHLIAHREWKTRPLDERYASLDALIAAVTTRRERSATADTDGTALRVEAADDDALRLIGADADLTNWSLGQIASLAGAPADYLRSLPAPLAADCLNTSLGQAGEARDLRTLLTLPEGADRPIVRAVTSQRYGRIWDADVARWMADMTAGGTWTPPLAYQIAAPADPTSTRSWPTMRADLPKVPSGLYASDRDVFVFLVDLARPIEVGTERLFRGIIARNSETGAAAFAICGFMFREVCGNHIIHGGKALGEIDVRHIGQAMERAAVALPTIRHYLDSGTDTERLTIEAARAYSIGTDDTEAESWIRGKGFTRKEATAASHYATTEEGSGLSSLWAAVQGLTAHARTLGHADKRTDLDRRAGALLDIVDSPIK